MDSSRDISFEAFFLNLTWYRPRDVIRVLKGYQKSNGDSQTLFEKGYDQVRFLKEYSRMSKIDCFAELEVKYTSAMMRQIESCIQRKEYKNEAELRDQFVHLQSKLEISELVQDLFDAGVIANHQNIKGRIEIYASYRGDTRLNPHIRVLIHRGLRMALQVPN
jgi:hypothetical protein